MGVALWLLNWHCLILSLTVKSPRPKQIAGCLCKRTQVWGNTPALTLSLSGVWQPRRNFVSKMTSLINFDNSYSVFSIIIEREIAAKRNQMKKVVTERAEREQTKHWPRHCTEAEGKYVVTEKMNDECQLNLDCVVRAGVSINTISLSASSVHSLPRALFPTDDNDLQQASKLDPMQRVDIHQLHQLLCSQNCRSLFSPTVSSIVCGLLLNNKQVHTFVLPRLWGAELEMTQTGVLLWKVGHWGQPQVWSDRTKPRT